VRQFFGGRLRLTGGKLGVPLCPTLVNRVAYQWVIFAEDSAGSISSSFVYFTVQL
jgi:hypothetical protein